MSCFSIAISDHLSHRCLRFGWMHFQKLLFWTRAWCNLPLSGFFYLLDPRPAWRSLGVTQSPNVLVVFLLLSVLGNNSLAWQRSRHPYSSTITLTLAEIIQITHPKEKTDAVFWTGTGPVSKMPPPKKKTSKPDISSHFHHLQTLGLRSVDHCVECLCSLSGNPYSDGLAVAALSLLVRGLRGVQKDPSDMEARSQCQLGIFQALPGREENTQDDVFMVGTT